MKIKNLKVYFSTCLLMTTLSSCKNINEDYKGDNNIIVTSSVEMENITSKCEVNDIIETKIDDKEIIEEENFDYIVQPKQTVDQTESVTISFTGDCTLGTYAKSSNRAFEVLFEQQKDYNYYFNNVKQIFENDDYTVVNLEGPLTDATVAQDKPFAFKGRKDYVNILLNGNVEAVNLSNNHIMDYYEEGFNDTVEVLNENNIDYFNNTIYHIEEINGYKFGFAGFKAFNLYTKNEIDNAIKYFNDNDVDIKIITLHGGIEYDYQFDSIKEELAHYSIDNGADLVVGHHPHILQGIEEYNNKYIIYSLGNFCYGGNRCPIDMNSMIAQVTFNFKDKKIDNYDLNLIPVSISSVDYENNFQPTILECDKKDKVLELINNYSKNFSYND